MTSKPDWSDASSVVALSLATATAAAVLSVSAPTATPAPSALFNAAMISVGAKSVPTGQVVDKRVEHRHIFLPRVARNLKLRRGQ